MMTDWPDYGPDAGRLVHEYDYRRREYEYLTEESDLAEADAVRAIKRVNALRTKLEPVGFAWGQFQERYRAEIETIERVRAERHALLFPKTEAAS